MATIVPETTRPDAPAGWLVRSGWSGKLFLAGGALGLVAAFLPLVSMSMQMMELLSGGQTRMVADDRRGKLAIPGYLAALAFALLLYPPGRSPARPMVWIGLAVGAGLVLLGGDLLIGTLRSRGNLLFGTPRPWDGGDMDMIEMANVRLIPGVGSFVNLAAALTVAVAAALKGREEALY